MGASLSLLTPVATGIGFVVAITGASHFFPYDGENNLTNTLLNVAHLGSFSFGFGVQLWMSFVHGLTLIKLVPRYTFAKIQDVFFDRFFLSGFVMNGIVLSTFLAKHPYRTWQGDSLYMGGAIIAGSIISTANILYIKDRVTSSMSEMHAFERENDLTYDDGTFKEDNFRENAEYMVVRKRFYTHHGISSLNNLVGVFASGVQLWLLARNLPY